MDSDCQYFGEFIIRTSFDRLLDGRVSVFGRLNEEQDFLPTLYVALPAISRRYVIDGVYARSQTLCDENIGQFLGLAAVLAGGEYQ